MPFTVSKRFCDVATRWLDTVWEEVIKDGHAYPDSEAFLAQFGWNGKVRITISGSENYHRHPCMNEEELVEDDECSCKPGHLFTFTLQAWGQRVEPVDYDIYEVVVLQSEKNSEIANAENIATSLEKVCQHIRTWEGKTFYECKYCSERIVYKDGKCKECYIHQYERTEDEGGECCICRENGGQWAELTTCGHIMHYNCCKKIERNGDKKLCCPLCRKAWYSPSDDRHMLVNIKHNPYDI